MNSKRPRATELLRLWLSYQRYAALVVVLSLGCVALVMNLTASWSTLWRWLAIAGSVGAALLGLHFARQIAGRWPRKLRATLLADRRIKAGRFRESSLQHYCEDPCFRVVANEILRRAGQARSERRELIRRYSEQAHEPAFLMTIDPSVRGTVHIEGTLFITNPPTPPLRDYQETEA